MLEEKAILTAPSFRYFVLATENGRRYLRWISDVHSRNQIRPNASFLLNSIFVE